MGVEEATAKLIVGLTSTFAGSVGEMIDPTINPNERYVFRDPYGGRLDENQAQWVAENARNEFAAAKSREAQTGFIDYNVPLVAGPGIRSQTADLFLPMRNQWSTAGGVSLNANAPTSSGFFSNHPYNPLAYNPLPYNPNNPGGFTPFNEVPPWGQSGEEGVEGESQHPGINDEQETIRQTIEREGQDDIARILKDIGPSGAPTDTSGTVAGDPNPIDQEVGGVQTNPFVGTTENSILSGQGSATLKPGGLANYADEVFGAHETWSDTPSQTEDWSWKHNLTGYDAKGKFAWGKDYNSFDTHGNPYAAAYAQQGLGGMDMGQKFKLPDLTSKGPQAKAPGKPAQVSGSENVWWQG